MSERRYRVLAVATHPVQYMAPLFRRMAVHPALDLHVAYCSLRGAEAGLDPEFGATLQWDVPLLEGYSWTHVANRGSGRESFFGLRNPGLWKLIRKGSFDAVLCYVGYVRASFWIAYFAAKASNAAFLFGTDSTTLEPRDGRTWKRVLKKVFWPQLFRLADQVIVPSTASRDLMASLGLASDRLTLTPYTVDNDWWIERSAEADRAATRASWGASPSSAVILFCAKLQPWKRPGDVLRAFARANLGDALLVLAGEGPLRGPLEAQAAELGVSGRVRLLGFVNQSQLPVVYASADLMVLPSEYEPFAVVVNEAMCCGCPVAASDRVGAARDLVAPVSPGFVFECGNISALAKILRDAVADRAQLASLGRAAIEHMRSWSPAHNIAATVAAIELAVSHARGRSEGAITGSTSARASASAPHKSHD
jgi:glycosyltransferase involved in cell wall biosynthesis